MKKWNKPHPHAGRAFRIGSIVAVALLLAASPLSASAQEAAQFFQQSCAGCHIIGGARKVGPDLKDVTTRRSRDWLVKFITDPQGMLATDPEARKLRASYTMDMPPVPGMTRALAGALLDLIETESKLPQSQFFGKEADTRPLTPEDAERGRELFLGYTRLAAGGPACISCHSAGGVGALGGGRLGPDLTRACERLGGAAGLDSWLRTLPAPTMQPVYKRQRFTDEEVRSLVAYFTETGTRGREDDGVAPLNFFLIGLGGAALALWGFDALWRRRFRAVRRPLVDGAANGGEA
jgi:mono/diheme cytochrome c family protein